ncbi:TetR/AcrR family transcriptional regulator [Streptomyces fragilis]|uniref:TetR/AcrR family transcriptional regulator n=1 Tax=Streptomyces fragilis TaxID=67301 RepID=UPI0024DE45E4|nr:TetR/AcrR family transcriptional regulator [Streptomyces fragilis]
MQDRAARTRRLVLRAAAREFDSNGYAGSSLSRITRAAGTSVGALTFHFPNKEELAGAVRAEGDLTTRATVRTVTARQEPALRAVASLSVALTTLLEEDVTVRAAARLSREDAGGTPQWMSAWWPAVEERLRSPGVARTSAEARALASLSRLLVLGAENDIRRRAACPGTPDGRPAQRVAHIWELVLRGLTTPPEVD